jgi:hypothetical protein
MDNRRSPDPRYGSWKFIDEIELADMLAHPVWLWCSQLGLPDEDDGPIGGNETSMRPLLQSNEVPLDHAAPPLILLRVKGSDYYASGLYDAKKRIIEAISVLDRSRVSVPASIANLPESPVYVAVPSIGGRQGTEFHSAAKTLREAEQKP